eukprot:Gregarina_sp_Pseudo_9__628@NODE_13_length_6388_cov_18_254528_g11_i0_p2_GENE_NODE_13_length_6388_cov_18_254528_g11_i0NODE_13_length_6388_cov_18_254528_g11_i0_p2_ORF_typecomplete_len386_score69_41LPP/PF04728_13/0_056LPP/PF04728_13/1e03DUF4763/PF15960_5/0_072SKA2/PF16740_5/0_17LRS4/PF10422_9/0_42_NODE_13_length_6388_cov_18_254528_g11_i039665123
MSMLDFVKRAFAEGGVQMEFLSSLLDCKDVTTDMPLEERFHLTLAEVLRLKTQVQTLQSQVSQMAQERDKMTLLIWTELSRLGHRLNPDGSPTNICDTPVRGLVEDAIKSTREDSTLRSLLVQSGYASSSSNDTPLQVESNSSVRAVKRARTSLKGEFPRANHGLEFDARDEEIMRTLKEDAVSPGPSGSSCVQTSALPTAGHVPAQSTPEQRILIDSWIAKQVQGASKHPNILNEIKGVEEGDWYCHVCCSLAKDGPPGDHFCFGRYENHRDNLKVFCQYCRKGTARMPDLRVHFRKIVYCRDLRTQLKMTLSKEPYVQTVDKMTSSPPPMSLDTTIAPTASTVQADTVSPALIPEVPVCKEATSPAHTETEDDPGDLSEEGSQ